MYDPKLVTLLQTNPRVNPVIEACLASNIAADIFFTDDPLRALGHITAARYLLPPGKRLVLVTSAVFHGPGDLHLTRFVEMARVADPKLWVFVHSSIRPDSLDGLEGFIPKGKAANLHHLGEDHLDHIAEFLTRYHYVKDCPDPLTKLYQDLPWLLWDSLD